MPYIGKSPQHGNYSKIDDISSGFDGSDATHAIASNSVAITPVRPEALIISMNGVIQEPVTDYTVSGTNITFTTAPASGDSFFGVAMGEQLAIGTPSDATVTSAKLSGNLVTPGTLDVNGQELILDANGNTSITADTDDQIDIKIAGADDFQFTANTFTAQAGSTIAAQALTATTVTPSGQLICSDGSVSAPAISFEGDLNSGFYHDDGADGVIRMSQNGTQTRLFNNVGGHFHGDTSNATAPGGMTQNQGAYDNEALSLKSSDVAHGYTGAGPETDTYAAFQKRTGAGGGLNIMAYGDNSTATFRYSAFQAGTNATSPSTTVAGAHDWVLYKHNGSGGLVAPSANEIMYTWQAYTGSADRTIMVLDEDGDLHLDGSSNDTAFDSEDDALLCRSLDIMRSPNGIIKSEFDKWTKDHKASLEDAGIISKIDPDNPHHRDEDGNIGEPLLNISQLQRLHNGAIWQQRAMFETMKQVAEELIPGFAKKLNARLAEQKLPALEVTT